MTSDEWDAIESSDGFRWVWNNPASAEQRLGPRLHKTRGAAIRAGKTWLSQRGQK